MPRPFFVSRRALHGPTCVYGIVEFAMMLQTLIVGIMVHVTLQLAVLYGNIIVSLCVCANVAAHVTICWSGSRQVPAGRFTLTILNRSH